MVQRILYISQFKGHTSIPEDPSIPEDSSLEGSIMPMHIPIKSTKEKTDSIRVGISAFLLTSLEAFKKRRQAVLPNVCFVPVAIFFAAKDVLNSAIERSVYRSGS